MDFLVDNYAWFKALHVVSVIAWMAGLLYLPRLFVYHSDAPAGGEPHGTFVVMERRLLKAIMNPAMIATYVFGAIMLSAQPSLLSDPWMHIKLPMIAGLTVMHMAMGRWRRAFEAGTNTHPARYYRMMNEVPTVMMIVIVIMAIVKPGF